MAEAQHYQVGDSVKVSAVFTDAAGAPTNPSTVTFHFKEQGQATLSEANGDSDVKNTEGTGHWHRIYVLAHPGVTEWAIVGTGAVARAARGSFTVLPTVP